MGFGQACDILHCSSRRKSIRYPVVVVFHLRLEIKNGRCSSGQLVDLPHASLQRVRAARDVKDVEYIQVGGWKLGDLYISHERAPRVLDRDAKVEPLARGNFSRDARDFLFCQRRVEARRRCRGFLYLYVVAAV